MWHEEGEERETGEAKGGVFFGGGAICWFHRATYVGVEGAGGERAFSPMR